MELESIIEGTKATIIVKGKVTVKSAGQFKAAVVQVPADVCDIDIDLTDVDYVSSAGLRVFVTAAKLSMSRGGTMRLLHPNEDVQDVLQMTNLGGIFTIVK